MKKKNRAPTNCVRAPRHFPKTVENSPYPKALANTAKHLAFTRCGELNLYDMIEAQIVIAEGELLAGQTLMS